MLKYLIYGLGQGGVFISMALAFGLIYRNIRVFHIALGGVVVAGAYAIYWGLQWGLGWALVLGLVASLLFSVIAVLLYDLALRRGVTAGLVLSLGLYVVAESVVSLLFGKAPIGLQRGVEVVSVAGVKLPLWPLISGVLGPLAVLGYWVFHRTRMGILFWALGDSTELVEILGWNSKYIKVLVGLVSGLLVFVGTVTVAFDVGIYPTMGWPLALSGAVAVLGAGRERWFGWCVVAWFLGIASSFVVVWIPAYWKEAVVFGFLLVVLLVKPQGLFTPSRREA